jgi:purine-binding chemotaxis protein CheW
MPDLPLKPKDPAASAGSRFLTFCLDGEVFGVGIEAVREVIQFTGLTPVPLMPAALRGVINLRGAVVPVVDLALRLGHPPTQPHRRTCLVILELTQDGQGTVLGVLVDQVREVLELAEAQLEPAPAFNHRLPAGFIERVGKAAGGFVLILAADRVLSIAELAGGAPEGGRGARGALEGGAGEPNGSMIETPV